MENTTGCDPTDSTNKAKSRRKTRQTERSIAFRKKKNAEFDDMLQARLNAKFALPAGAFLHEDGTYHLPFPSTPPCDEEVTCDYDSGHADVPVPVPTAPITLLTDCLYDGVKNVEDNISDVCSRKSLHIIVQAKLLAQTQPDKFNKNFPDQMKYLDFLLPRCLEDVIDQSTYSIPVSDLPNKYVSNRDVDIKTLNIKPVILDCTDQSIHSSVQHRFYNIFNLVGDSRLHLCSSDVKNSESVDFAGHAANVKRLLEYIPNSSDSRWKCGPSSFGGNASRMNFLLYGPYRWCKDREPPDFHLAPPLSSRVMLRSSTGEGDPVFGLFDDLPNDRELSRVFSFETMRRACVKKAFRGLGTIPLKRDGSNVIHY